MNIGNQERIIDVSPLDEDAVIDAEWRDVAVAELAAIPSSEEMHTALQATGEPDAPREESDATGAEKDVASRTE